MVTAPRAAEELPCREGGALSLDVVPDTEAPPQLARFIQRNLPILPAPLVPEVRLHTAVPTSGLRRLAEIDPRGFGPPYWAHSWGGGVALARYLLDRPDAVLGRRALDLGCGSGLVGIAAAIAGAAKVICADTDRYAVAAARLNAEINGVAIFTAVGDLTSGPPPPVDAVLVGDLFYERELAACITAFLDRCLASRIDVLVGDPWRAHLPHSRLRLLAEYTAPDFGEASRRTAVFRFTAG